MDSFAKTFYVSVETSEGVSYQHPYHFGTQEPLARSMIKEMYAFRVKYNIPVYTIALKFDGHIIDVFDGRDWNSEILDRASAEMMQEWA
jgi:hypothetical protein